MNSYEAYVDMLAEADARLGKEIRRVNRLLLSAKRRLEQREGELTRLSRISLVVNRIARDWWACLPQDEKTQPIMTDAWFYVRELGSLPEFGCYQYVPMWIRNGEDGTQAGIERQLTQTDRPIRDWIERQWAFGDVDEVVRRACPACQVEALLVGRRDLLKWDLDDSPFKHELYTLCLSCLTLTEIAAGETVDRITKSGEG